MEPAEIAPGLWRWTAPHPEWEPGAEPGSPADWPEQVGSVLVESQADVVVLVDPQLPPEPGLFWAWADELVRGRPVFVVTTIEWHGRSRDAFAARYPSPDRAPADVELLEFPPPGETMVWLPAQRTLVPGDRLIGTTGGDLRLCPESWLRYLPGTPTLAELRATLRPLLELPVERVLVSHGEPVLAGGREALARAMV